jgi:hypothetical protein
MKEIKILKQLVLEMMENESDPDDADDQYRVHSRIISPDDPDYTRDQWGNEIPYIHLLGTAPDAEIARGWGASPSTVWLDRKRRGIPNFMTLSRKKAVDPIAHLLGTKPDQDLADEHDIPVSWIERGRIERRIPAMKVPRQALVLPYEDLLGKVPDTVIARQFGVTTNNIAYHRNKRGIPAFKPS